MRSESWKALFTSLLSFVLVFIVFSMTVCPSVGHGHDTGEMISAGCTLGIPHPPGYPFYVRLSHLWVELLPFGRPDWRMNLFSGFCVALGSAFLTDALRRVTGYRTVAVASSLMFAFCRSVWRQSVIAEVFGLHWAYLCIFCWLAVLWSEASDSRRFVLINITAFMMGNCLAHHHTILFAGPGLLIYCLITKGRGRPWGFSYNALALFLLGWIPFYVDMMARSQAMPYLNWGAPNTPDEMRNHFLRRAYGTFSLSLANKEIGSGVAHTAAYFVSLTRSQFFMPIILLAAVGLQGVRYSKSRAATALFFAWFFVQGPFFALYAKQPPGAFYIDMQERFYASSYLGAVGLMAIGVQLLLDWYPSRKVRLGLMAAYCFLPVCLLWNNWSQCSEADLWVGYDTAKAQFDACPKRALLIMDGDLACGVSEYLKTVEGDRPDLNVLFPGVAGSIWGLQNLEHELRGAVVQFVVSGADNDAALEACARIHRARGFSVIGGNRMNIPGSWVRRGVVWEWYPDDAAKPSPAEELKLQEAALDLICNYPLKGRHYSDPSNGFWVNYSLDVWIKGLRGIAETTFKDKPEVAIRALEKIKDFCKPTIQDDLNLGFLYKDVRQPVKAEAYFRQVLETDTQNRLARAGLCDLYESLGRIEEASKLRKELRADKS
jgi:FtsH-binding integral membrane protein/tetratricopeptide (TPR) repeat protein